MDSTGVSNQRFECSQNGKMPEEMHLSISSYLWHEEPFLNHLETVVRSGFDALEIFATRKHLDLRDPDAVQETGLALRRFSIGHVTLHAPKIGIDLSSPDPMQRDESVQTCLRVLDAATLLGVSLVTFHPSGVETEIDDNRTRWPALMVSLKQLARYAADRDLHVGVENHPRPLFCEDPVELSARIRKLGMRNVGISLDLGHAYVNGQLPDCIYEMECPLFAVQASDTRGHSDEHFFPGHGDVAWQEIFSALSDVDYRGPIIIEIKDERPLGVVLEDLNRFAAEMGLYGVEQCSS